MADLKSIANMQIGGPKYPKKRRINLYQKQTKKENSGGAGRVCRFYGFCLRIFEIWRNASPAGGRPGRGGLCGDGEGASYIGEIQRGVR